MTAYRPDRLYNLLPALYRRLDEREGQPLRALMAVLESEFRRLEWDTEAMYDDWFIETCDRWVVPYIADLLGIRHLQDMDHIPHQRRLVANSLAYRRRKGTPAILEQVIRDATGWYARCVEFAHLVAKTQHVAYPQQDRGCTVDVRRLQGIARIDGPFEPLVAHTLDVDDGDQGRYNAECVGLFLYRLRSYPVRRSFAHPVKDNPGCFTFDPLGRDIRLFNRPEPVVHTSQRTQAINLPFPLSRADLARDLQAHRAVYGHLPKQFQPDESLYYGPDRSLHIELPPDKPKIKPTAVVSMDLSQWPPALSKPAKAVVAVDVALGRIAFVDQEHLTDQVDIDVKECTINIRSWDAEKGPGYVVVNYNYGFSSEVGGGPYDRELRLPQPAESIFQINVAQGAAVQTDPSTGADQGTGGATAPGCVPTLQEALESCSGRENPCVIRILDNGLYDEQLVIKLPKGTDLSIVADTGVRPVIGQSAQPIVVCLEKATEGEAGAEGDRRLHLSGLSLLGRLAIRSQGQKEAAGRLIVTISHCTLANLEDGKLKPAPIVSVPAVHALELDIQHSILGPLYLPDTTEKVTVSYSIVDNGSDHAIAADTTGVDPGPTVDLERVTVFGRVHAQKVVASEVIFGGPLKAPVPETKDQIRHSYVPQGSTTREGEPHPAISRDVAPPRFTSTQYGDPGYAQLSLDCPREIRGGAADGSEVGAFHDSYHLQAEENLREVLEEYLPLGLQASIEYVT